MSVEEAVQLVLQAAALRAAARCSRWRWVQPVNILELADGLIRLSGQRARSRLAVQVIGARPGEQRREELVDVGELPARGMRASW